MRLCELREKEVINTCDCKRLGCVEDVILDLCKGRVEAIVIPVPGKICGLLGSDKEYIIPVECIRKIGPDIILVDIVEEKFIHSCKLC
ncbi:MAG: YlmC/YmxH family sporulation protein [Hespellia sp.]|nr:YlmC/YmxH family sporulation protein [Hespellia sp.]